jgi:hypothetical protein
VGGATCAIIVHALVKFQSVPTDPAQLPVFDEQMRKCLGNDTIAQAVVDDTNKAYQVCDILQKAEFTAADRAFLWGILAAYSATYS